MADSDVVAAAVAAHADAECQVVRAVGERQRDAARQHAVARLRLVARAKRVVAVDGNLQTT